MMGTVDSCNSLSERHVPMQRDVGKTLWYRVLRKYGHWITPCRVIRTAMYGQYITLRAPCHCDLPHTSGC